MSAHRISEEDREKQLSLFEELANSFQPKFGGAIGYADFGRAFSGDRQAFRKLFQHVLAVLWHTFYKNSQRMKELVGVEDIKWACMFLGYVPVNYRICFREDNVNFLALGEILKFLYYKNFKPENEQAEKGTLDRDPLKVLEQIVRPVYHSDPFFNMLEKWYHDQMNKLHLEQKMLMQIKKTISQILDLDWYFGILLLNCSEIQ